MIHPQDIPGAVAAALLAGASTHALAQQTTLRIFTGGQQRPDVMRQIADDISGATQREGRGRGRGATSEQQQQYLNTVLASKDSVADVILIDVIRPAQWSGRRLGRASDSYLGAGEGRDHGALPAATARRTSRRQGDRAAVFRRCAVPVLPQGPAREAGRAASQDMDELKAGAEKDHEGGGQSEPLGFQTAGAPIEGTVCTYLVPMWARAARWTNAQGQLQR